MSTTLHIADELARELRERANAEGVSLEEFSSRVLREGLESRALERKPFRQKVYNMGTPCFNVDKALAFAAELEDEEIIRKMSLGK